MAGLNRRDFLTALGLGGTATAVSACGFDDNLYRTPIEQVLPYVQRPDQIIPGNPTFFATTVQTGPSAFPVLGRHRDGRVINVGANLGSKAPAPWQPSVPAPAILELQRHWSPDRYQTVMQGGAASDWEKGQQALVDAVKAAKAGGKKVAWLGQYRSGAIVELIRDFTAGEAVFFEPLGRDAEADAAQALFGARALPAWDLSKAHYVLSFGLEFMGGAFPALASQYAQARNPNVGGFIARFALVSGFRGQTGANADDWYRATPGSEAKVALAVAKLVADKVGYNGPLSSVVAAGDPAGAAAAAGLTAEDLEFIAAQFAAGPAVALPGGSIGASKAAVDLALAVYVLNVVSGNAGVTFGLGGYEGPIDGLERLVALIADMKAGNVGVLLIDDHTNPVYAAPKALGFQEALATVGLVVSVSSHPDETNANATLILPTLDTLEDWGDEEPAAGVHLLRQPLQKPFGSFKSLGDLLLEVARAAELQPLAAPPTVPTEPVPAGTEPAVGTLAPAALGFVSATWREYLQARWKRDVWPTSNASFADFWFAALADGFVDRRTAVVSAPSAVNPVSIVADAAVGGEGDVILVAHPHPLRQDGRFANQPWSQEVPDPMTGIVWDSVVEIHPETAASLGITENSLVEVKTAAGSLRLGARPLDTVQKGVVAIAFGNGHTANGRYADNTGVNVVDLFGAPEGAHLAWVTKAKVTNTGELAELVNTFGSDDDAHRSFGYPIDATALAAVGDSEAEEPGHLNNAHELPWDERLGKAGINDMYEPPEHPVYRFGMTVDVNACNGCGACSVACYAENNLAIVGKWKINEGREMSWIRVDRFMPNPDGQGGKEIKFVPMMCQQCAAAPCESVCPVIATYHSIDGLNAMVYNRCVGTRYCSNNCPYKARRFNWHTYTWPEPFNLQLNPDVSVRTMGVMEKCTFCVQRIRTVKSAYRNQGFTTTVPDAALRSLPACAEACPTNALTFGNIEDPESVPHKTRKSGRTQFILADLNTKPGVNYLGKATFNPPAAGHHAAAGEGEHGAPHEPAPAGEHGGEAPPAEHH